MIQTITERAPLATTGCAATPAAASSRAAFSSVSAHSSSALRVGDDAAADAEVRAAARDRERADRDRELGAAAVGVDPADRAAVDAAPHRLEVFDRLHARAASARR